MSSYGTRADNSSLLLYDVSKQEIINDDLTTTYNQNRVKASDGLILNCHGPKNPIIIVAIHFAMQRQDSHSH